MDEVENEQPIKILRLWVEQWEQKKAGPQGNQILELEARLTKKYQEFKFCDIHSNNRVRTVFNFTRYLINHLISTMLSRQCSSFFSID